MQPRYYAGITWNYYVWVKIKTDCPKQGNSGNEPSPTPLEIDHSKPSGVSATGLPWKFIAQKKCITIERPSERNKLTPKPHCIWLHSNCKCSFR